MSNAKISLGGLFFLLLLWSVAGLVDLLGWDAGWLLVAVGLVTASFLVWGLVVFALHRVHGYWVEYVSPGLLQAGDGGFGLVYHEGRHQLMLLGVRRPIPQPDVLFVPAEDTWVGRVEPWARSRRAQILDRLLHDPVASHCEIRSSSLP